MVEEDREDLVGVGRPLVVEACTLQGVAVDQVVEGQEEGGGHVVQGLESP